MKIEELIEGLKGYGELFERRKLAPIPCEFLNEIIKGLEELKELRKLSYRAFKLLEEIAHS